MQHLAVSVPSAHHAQAQGGSLGPVLFTALSFRSAHPIEGTVSCHMLLSGLWSGENS